MSGKLKSQPFHAFKCVMEFVVSTWTCTLCWTV